MAGGGSVVLKMFTHTTLPQDLKATFKYIHWYSVQADCHQTPPSVSGLNKVLSL